jgi:hypothetical protein
MNEATLRNFTINFGPQHPAAHGVLRLVQRVGKAPKPRAGRSRRDHNAGHVVFLAASIPQRSDETELPSEPSGPMSRPNGLQLDSSRREPAASAGRELEADMNIDVHAPTMPIFLVSLVLAVLALLGYFVVIPYITLYGFWIAIIAYVVLAVGNVMKT